MDRPEHINQGEYVMATDGGDVLRDAAMAVREEFPKAEQAMVDEEMIGAIVDLIAMLSGICGRKDPETLVRLAARGRMPTRWAVRNAAEEVVEARYGDRAKVGRWTFRDLRNRLADATLAATAGASPDRVREVVEAGRSRAG